MTLTQTRQPNWRLVWKKKTPDRVSKVDFLKNEDDLLKFAVLCQKDDKVLVFEFDGIMKKEVGGSVGEGAGSSVSRRKDKSKSKNEIKVKVTNRLKHSREVVDFKWRKSEGKE